MEDYQITIHDCFVSVVGVQPNEEEIETIYMELPMRIKHLGEQWGWYDTEVRDGVYVWLKEKNGKK